MRKFKFEIAGALCDGAAVLEGGKLWIHLNGENFAIETPDTSVKGNRRGLSKGRGASAAQPGQVIAPMPGKIIKVMVAQGAVVSVGQVLLVMEAMKMEYTLKAHGPGRVESVKCVTGEQVSLGQLLIKLETE